jgi:hypothetical protein
VERLEGIEWQSAEPPPRILTLKILSDDRFGRRAFPPECNLTVSSLTPFVERRSGTGSLRI